MRVKGDLMRINEHTNAIIVIALIHAIKIGMLVFVFVLHSHHGHREDHTEHSHLETKQHSIAKRDKPGK
jgi:hypothetical protein